MRPPAGLLGLFCVAAVIATAWAQATPSPLAAPVAPPVPTGLSNIDYGSRYVTVTWNGVSAANVIYELQASLRTAGANDTLVSFVRTTATQATLTGLIPGRVYAVRVRSVDPRYNVTSAYSSGLAFLMGSEPPDAPGRVRQVSKTGTSITIAWERPNNNGKALFGYEVHMDNGPGTPVRAVRNTSREGFRVDYLNMGVFYRFQIYATNALGRGPPSPLLAIRTSAPPEQPEPPRLVQARDFGMVVGYVPPDPNDAAISLYRIDVDRLDGRSFYVAGNASGLTFDIRGLIPAQPYAVRVCALNANGFGPPSHPAIFRTRPGVPLAPVNVTAASRTPYSINLTWAIPWDSGSPVQFVEVWRGPALDLEFSPLGNSSRPFYDVTGLKPGSLHAYKVRAVNALGYSAFSAAVELLAMPTVPDAPTNVRALYIDTGSAIIWWDPGAINGAPFLRYEALLSIPGGPKSDDRFANVTEAEYRGRNMYPGMQYSIVVRTLNTVGPSAFTAPFLFLINYRAPDPPDPPVPVDHTESSITFAWYPPGEDGGKPITGYVVYIDDGFSGPFGIYAPCSGVGTSPTQCEVTGLKPNQYRVRVAARNDVGLSAPSGILSYATFFKGLDVYDFNVAGGIALAGAAHLYNVKGYLRLTDALPNDVIAPNGYAGAAWSMQALDIAAAFDVRWVFSVSGRSPTCKAPVPLPRDCVPRGGDGLALVVWVPANATDFFVGAPAEGLGYAGLANSLAVEFDTWSNAELGDPYDNHVSVQTRGPLPNSPHHAFSLAAATVGVPDLADGAEHRARVVYTPWFDHELLSRAVAPQQVGAGPALFPYTEPGAARGGPGVLAVYVDDAHVLSVAVDLASVLDWSNGTTVRLGFTAGTGTAYQTHDLVTWVLFSGLQSLST